MLIKKVLAKCSIDFYKCIDLIMLFFSSFQKVQGREVENLFSEKVCVCVIFDWKPYSLLVYSVLKDLSTKGKGKAFNGVNRSKRKGNHAVFVIEETASITSKLGNTNGSTHESNAGILKRK